MMEDIGKLILRVSFGALMLPHGYKKLLKFFADEPIKFADPFGAGEVPSLMLVVLAEFFCSILIIIGFKTRFATMPLMITMLTAAFWAHIDDPWAKKEFALLYFFGYLALAFLQSGKYSVDGLLKK